MIYCPIVQHKNMKKNIVKSTPVGYKLLKVITTEFSFNGPKKPFTYAPGSVNYNVLPKVGLNPDLSQVIVTLEIAGNIKHTEEEFFKTSSTFIFEVEDMEELIKWEDKKPVFKDSAQEISLFCAMIGIAYSTCRGIVMEKGARTILQSDILPLVNPMIFINKNSLKFKSKSKTAAK